MKENRCPICDGVLHHPSISCVNEENYWCDGCGGFEYPPTILLMPKSYNASIKELKRTWSEFITEIKRLFKGEL